jgi:hypothetical protein
MMNKRFFIVLFVFSSFESVWSQQGFLNQYPTLKGNEVISRITSDGQYRVTSYTSEHNISSLIVTDGTVTYNCPSSYYVTPNPLNPGETLNYGFSIKDMKTVGDTCWICGSYWRETGEWMYTPSGNMYWNVAYTGFVGYIVLSNVLTEQCPFRYVLIPNTQRLNKMVLHQNKIAATAEWSSYKNMVVELTRNNSTQWSYRVGKSTFAEEQFEDITYAGGAVVTLVRFGDPQHQMFHRHGIGLRYGSPGDLLDGSRRVYCYSTHDFDGTSSMDFAPEGRLVFGSAHGIGAVEVEYVCNPTVPMERFRGSLVHITFHNENDHHPLVEVEAVSGRRGTPYGLEATIYPHIVDSAMYTILADTAKVTTIKFYPEEVSPVRQCTDVN